MKMLKILKIAEEYGISLSLSDIQEARQVIDKAERRNLICQMINTYIY